MKALLLTAIAFFSFSSVAQITGSYSSNQAGLGCFGEYMGDRFDTTVELEIGEFAGETAGRRMTMQLKGVSYPINCTVVYEGKITGTPDGRYLGGLKRTSCSCNVPGGNRQCKRRIDPFVLESENQELRVVTTANEIKIQQLKEPPKSDAWPCGDGYPEFTFKRK